MKPARARQLHRTGVPGDGPRVKAPRAATQAAQGRPSADLTQRGLRPAMGPRTGGIGRDGKEGLGKLGAARQDCQPEARREVQSGSRDTGPRTGIGHRAAHGSLACSQTRPRQPGAGPHRTTGLDCGTSPGTHRPAQLGPPHRCIMQANLSQDPEPASGHAPHTAASPVHRLDASTRAGTRGTAFPDCSIPEQRTGSTQIASPRHNSG